MTVNQKHLMTDFNKNKEDIHNKYQGETGLLIANGPSLRSVPLDFLRKYKSIGTNNIYLYNLTDEEIDRYPNNVELKFSPNFYTILGIDQLDSEEDLSYIRPVLEFCEYAFINRLVYPAYDKDKVYAIHSINHETGKRANPKQTFSFEPLKTLGIGYTNTYIMLQIMYYLGFTKLYIVGLDNDYGADPNQLHYYKNDPRFACEPYMGRTAHRRGSNMV
ncbi:MAG: hypothetical protein DRJ03_19835, partial [Chloroflexi bacterium]